MTEESAMIYIADSFFIRCIMDLSLLKIKKEKITQIDVKELMPNPLQPRRRFDEGELNSLCDSIRVYGVIQPLAVKKIENLPFPMPKTCAKYEIIAGERRWRASKMAGLTSVPCIVFDADRTDSALMALVENLQRADLSFFEEALAMQTLLLMTGKSQTDLSKALSISQSTLSNKIRLLRLSERERLMAMENGFSERHCRALVRIETERERRPIMLTVIKDKLSAPETEKMVEDILIGKQPKEQPTKLEKIKPKRRIKGCIKDMRILYNTLDKAVKLLSTSGYNANWTKEETDKNIEVKISIALP